MQREFLKKKLIFHDEQTSDADQLAVQLLAAFYGVVAVGQHLKDGFSIQFFHLNDPHLNIY